MSTRSLDVDPETTSRSEPDARVRTPRWRNRIEIVGGLALLLTLFAVSWLVGFIRPFSAHEVAGAAFQAPNTTHWLGTDDVGRDYFVRVCEAGRVSMSIALASALLAMIIGSTIGLFAGLIGGWVESISMALIDLLLSFPSMLLALGVVAVLSPTTPTLIAVLAPMPST